MSNSYAPRKNTNGLSIPPPKRAEENLPPSRTAQDAAKLIGPDIASWLGEMGLEAHIQIRNRSGEEIATAQRADIFEEASRHHKRAAVGRDLSALGSLTASMSHEVRNILSGVLGLSQLRSRSGPEAKIFATIAVEAARGTQLLSNFLSVSHDSESSTQLAHLSDIFEPIRLLTVAEAHRRHSTIEFEDQAKGLPFVTDSNRAKQILLNLLLNALQASGENGALKVTGKLDGPWVVFTVDDNGPGVPEDERQKIFEPFYSTKRAQGGTGLGLSKAMQLVKELGGQLRVCDSPLGGARFELRLPTRHSTANAQAVKP